MAIKKTKEQTLQDEQYIFPYHYIPGLENGELSIGSGSSWGMEYISYIDFIVNIVKGLKFKTLVDIGCGDGRMLFELKKTIKKDKLVGIDYSEKAILLAQAMCSGVSFIHRDIIKSKTIIKAEVVTLVETLEHIPLEQVSTFLESTANHLKRGGTLIITVPLDTVPVNEKHYQHFNLRLLKKYLEKHFVIKKHFYVNRKNNDIRLVFLNFVLSNSFYILNNKKVLTSIYRYYKKSLFMGSYSQSQRIIVIATKK